MWEADGTPPPLRACSLRLNTNITQVFKNIWNLARCVRVGFSEGRSMRTIVTLDEDVAALLEDEMKRTDQSFKQTLNDALRRGLRTAVPNRKPFQVLPPRLASTRRRFGSPEPACR